MIYVDLPTGVQASPPAMAASAEPARVEATRYDIARNTPEIARHFLQTADDRSAIASLVPQVRRIARERCRAEAANHAVLAGMVQTLTIDTIGRGPTLQLDLPMGEQPDDDLRAEIDEFEVLFQKWARAIALRRKLSVMVRAEAIDGEAFGVMLHNPKIKHPIQLDLRLLEADQVESSPFVFESPEHVSGIDYDTFGNPIRYHVRVDHPGEVNGLGASLETTPVDAEDMLHLFDWQRPGQRRGFPAIAAAIPLLANLRRFGLATVAQAETNANFAVFFKTDTPPDGQTAKVATGLTLPLANRMAVTLPAGWEAQMLQPGHGGATYGEYYKSVVTEAARAVLMPYCIAFGDSSGHSYASARLDFQSYNLATQDRQMRIEELVIAPLLDKYLWYAVKSDQLWAARAGEGKFSYRLRSLLLRLQAFWAWPIRPHVDVEKTMNADIEAVRHGLKTWGDCVRQYSTRDPRSQASMIRSERAMLGGTQLEFMQPKASQPASSTASGQGSADNNLQEAAQ
jgi:capsid protein